MADEAARHARAAIRHGVGAYLLAVSATVIAAALRWALDPLLRGTGEYLTFYFSVLCVAVIAGVGPGAAAVVLGGVIGKVMFVELGHATGGLLDYTIRLILFVLYGATALALVERLRRSEARSGRLRRSAEFPEENPNPMFRLDPAGRFLYANEACGRLLTGDCRQGADAPDPARDAVRTVLRGDAPSQVDLDLAGGDGRVFTFTCVGVPHRRHVNFYGRDVTEARRALMEIERERARWKQVVEGIADEVWVCDTNGRMSVVNLRAATHMRLEEFKDKSVDQVLEVVDILNLDGQIRPVEDAPLLRALKGEVVRGEEIMRHRATGTTRWREFTAAPIRDPSGAIAGSVAVVRDVTDYRRMDADLREAHARLAEANRMKDEFLATLSHELRTPLNAIVGWSDMLRRGNLPSDDTQRAVESIYRNARLQNELINDVLDVSRIISGKVRIEPQPVDLLAVLNDALDSVRSAADAKGVAIVSQCETIPFRISGDPTRLQQVFWNILSNAVKFTPRDGRVQVSTRLAGAQVHVRVEDTGIGISADFLPYVFERFRQKDSSMTRNHGGLGLGLAIVRHLIELHGGLVRAESAGEGQGATFTVTLPARPFEERRQGVEPAVRRARVPAVVPVADEVPSLCGVRVLVVDDEDDAREVAESVLRHHGADVELASDAVQAFEKFRAFDPDVLLVDLAMPGTDGFTLLRRIRGSGGDKGAVVPAIALTAYAREEDQRRALESGFQLHVPKPVDSHALIRTIASARRATSPSRGGGGGSSGGRTADSGNDRR